MTLIKNQMVKCPNCNNSNPIYDTISTASDDSTIFICKFCPYVEDLEIEDSNGRFRK